MPVIRDLVVAAPEVAIDECIGNDESTEQTMRRIIERCRFPATVS
jgi:hypothetical protein